MISIDYIYLKDGKDVTNPRLAIHDTESQGAWALMGRRKSDDEHIAHRARPT